MTNSPPSSSDSESFGLLHPQVQRWIWQQNWTELRDIQDDAVPVILAGDRDVLIGAATAGGKTEAAFLPVVSAISENHSVGFKALYVSPLKALINDQFRRLESLCELADIPVFRWHGDVSASTKRQAREKPDGIVLITPESLEALFVRRGNEIVRMFSALRYVIVDELHAFIGTARGMQLQSLLTRLEVAIDRPVPRIGLSATLGDLGLAAECLRPGGGSQAVVLESKSDGRELRVQVRGYVGAKDHGPDEENSGASTRHAIADHLFDRLRGSHNLVFAGSRRNVELFADALRSKADDLGLPNEFFPHHGNLSRDLRESVEQRLKEGRLPTTAVCTTTLELGIDIGEVESVAQIGAPRSIAALRQRLGRSGRRKGKPAVLRIYVEEQELTARSHPLDTLRLEIVQAVAAIKLLIDGWCEPPVPSNLHLSTLSHQLLALIAQYGGVRASRAFSILADRGPFGGVPKSLFSAVLRNLGSEKNCLIEQAPDGLLMLGEAGERLVENYRFYAVFETPEEYRVMSEGRQLGVLPVDSPLVPEMMIVFAGRRWTVVAVRESEKVLEVAPASGGVPPRFAGGDYGPIHDKLVREMVEVFENDDIPSFLDPSARQLLVEARNAYRDFGVDRASIIPHGERTILFPWVGSVKRDGLFLELRARGFSVDLTDFAIEIRASVEDVVMALNEIALSPVPDAVALARGVENKIVEKYDCYLGDELLSHAWAAERIDARAIPVIAAKILSHCH